MQRGRIGLAFAILAAITLAGCGNDTDELYPMSRGEVATRLATAVIPGEIKRETDGLSGRVFKRGESQVVWEFSAAGQPLASYTAELTPEDGGTRVTGSFAMAESRIADAARADIGGSSEFFEALVNIGMAEHIDSTLERRRFDDDKLMRSLAAFAATHPEAAKRHIARMQQMEQGSSGSAIEREMAAMREDATEHEAAMAAQAEPMDDTAPADQFSE